MSLQVPIRVRRTGMRNNVWRFRVDGDFGMPEEFLVAAPPEPLDGFRLEWAQLMARCVADALMRQHDRLGKQAKDDEAPHLLPKYELGKWRAE